MRPHVLPLALLLLVAPALALAADPEPPAEAPADTEADADEVVSPWSEPEATPATPSAPAPYVDPERDVPYPRRAHFALRGVLGASLRALYGITLPAGSLGFGLGADTRAGYYGFYGQVVAGVTEEGIGHRQFTGGADCEWMVGDVVRLGVNPRAGWFELDSVTSPDSTTSFSVGVAGRVAFDLHREDGLSVALGLEPSVDVLVPFLEVFDDSESPPVLGVGTFLQIRWRAPRGAPKPKPPKP